MLSRHIRGQTAYETKEIPVKSACLASAVLFVSVLISQFTWAPFAGAQEGVCDEDNIVSGERVALALVFPFFEHPVQILSPPGDTDRLFIVQRNGIVRLVDLADDSVVSSPFLNLSSKIGQVGEEQGLAAIAFHPQFAENREFFVHYTTSVDASVIARFRVSESNANLADATSEEILLEVDQPSISSNGGALLFDQTGHLLIGIGDGGLERTQSAQNPFSLLGKMLRIDVDGGAKDAPYGIPADNPFAQDDNVAPEVWALGLHDPRHVSMDSETGDIYLPDIGDDWREELNFRSAAEAGALNLQWPRWEGTREVNRSVFVTAGVHTGPIHEYTHLDRSCPGRIIGGVVYRGCEMPDLQGTYFFADQCHDEVWSLRVVDGEAVNLRNRTAEMNVNFPGTPVHELSAIGMDDSGRMYFGDLSGKLFRLVPRTTNLAPTARISSDPAPANLVLDAEPVSILLDGTASDDGDGGTQPLEFAWSKVSGPDGDNLSTPEAASTEIAFSEPGTYRYELSVDDGEASNATEIEVLVVRATGTNFRRGDSNLDGTVDLSDGVFTLRFLFLGGTVDCRDSADANDTGDLDLSDAVVLFNYLFLGGSAPPAPGPDACGEDPTADLLAECEPPSPCI